MRHSNPFRYLTLVSLFVAACGDTTGSSAVVINTNPALEAQVAPRALQNDSRQTVTILRDPNEGHILRIHGEFVSSEPLAERAARLFLSRHADLFELTVNDADLTLGTTRQGLAGTYFRFQQKFRGFPVFDAEVIVLVKEMQGRQVVREVNLAHRRSLSILESQLAIGSKEALVRARAHVGSPVEGLSPEIMPGIAGAPARLVYRVRISAETPVAAWEVMVDATTGNIVSSRDRIKRVTGTGMVFDPNPLASTGDFTITDNGDATSPVLDAARYSVPLPNLDGSGFLRGLWVDARTKNANGRAQSATNTFNFDRSQSGFEQTNIYYHLDRTQTRIQAIGILSANARQQEVLSDGQQVDNSYYDPQKLLINCGKGGVDDAEDADVVVHEYGHAIQDDQVPNYGAGNESGAMGEGFGDYLALSMDRLFSHKIDDPYCLAEWDATAYDNNIPPCLRRTDSVKHFPEHFVNQVHTDGEMWSAATSSLDMTLGPEVMNRLVIEAHFSHSTTETFFGATQSILDVDAMVFGGTHQDAIRRRFIKQGLSRILSTPSPFNTLITSIPVSIDNPRVGNTYDNLLDDEQTFTYPGAQALRVHFAQITTQASATCTGGGCDNIYLTNALGDLYQILFGNSTNLDSVVIPGDTVNIRLVTDDATQNFGYHVDRIDVIGDGNPGSSSSGMGGMGTGGADVGGNGGMVGSGGAGGTGGGGMGGASSSSTSASSSSSTSASSSSSGSSSTSSSSSSSSSSSGGDQNPTEPGGCGCRTVGGESSSAPLSFAGAIAALIAYRRRRNTRR
jgi:hypothetical protein